MGKTKVLSIQPTKKCLVSMEIVGSDNLVLHKKDRCYELREVFKQTHEKGTEVPRNLNTNNPWQYLISGITWLKPITFHDDDPEMYSEDEWNDYMKNNKPCITTYAFKKSFEEGFKSLGFKESTGKNGTDVARALGFSESIIPITFETVRTESKIVNTQSNGGGSGVVCHENIFSGWKTHLNIIIPNNAFPPETIVSLVKTCGEFLGVGSRRKHGFGRYAIGELVVDPDYGNEI